MAFTKIKGKPINERQRGPYPNYVILEIPTTQSDFLFNEKSQTILPFIVFIHADSNNLETKHCHFIGICDTPVYLRCSHAFLSDFASQLINLLRAIAFFSLHSGGLQQNLPYDRGDSKSFKKEGGGHPSTL